MAAILYICETCRFSREDYDQDGQTGGARLAALLAERIAAEGAAVQLRTMRCMMACSRHCVAQLQAPGKLGYVMGGLPPDAASADTLLACAERFAQSPDGRVAYAEWPEAMREHFIARVPALEIG